mmetsp:Transcript_21787/g.60861  ORF Transcript_21787/g.60861 Transcript_21787/m.60861 type:complete len:472 (-) Transcript_21787:203-1618(-)
MGRDRPGRMAMAGAAALRGGGGGGGVGLALGGDGDALGRRAPGQGVPGIVAQKARLVDNLDMLLKGPPTTGGVARCLGQHERRYSNRSVPARGQTPHFQEAAREDAAQHLRPRGLREQWSPLTPQPPAAQPRVSVGLRAFSAEPSPRSNWITDADDRPASNGYEVECWKAARTSAPSRRSTVGAWAVPLWQPYGARCGAVVSLASNANAQYRPYMEDGHMIVDPLVVRSSADDRWGFFAVYDGHGGRSAVDYCEEKLHTVVADELSALARHDSNSVCTALNKAFQSIDRQLGMVGAWKYGCTATVVLTHTSQQGLTVYTANVGDSRGLLIGEHEKKRVTTDHRPSNPLEAKRIKREGGVVFSGRVGGQLSVSRSLGDHHLKDSGLSCVPDVCVHKADGSCALILASDGVWDVMDDGEAKEVLERCMCQAAARKAGGKNATDRLREDVANAVVNRAIDMGSQDNILSIVVFL